MIQPEDIELLHRVTLRLWKDGHSLDEALVKIRNDAGVAWTTNMRNNRFPDKKGKKGSWKIVDGEVFVIWKMKNR